MSVGELWDRDPSDAVESDRGLKCWLEPELVRPHRIRAAFFMLRQRARQRLGNEETKATGL